MTICAVCAREVRYGTRGGREAWWHADDRPDTSIVIHRRLGADGSLGHEPVLGHRTLIDFSQLPPMKAAKDSGESDDRIFDIPPVEVWADRVELEDERMPGGARALIKATVKLDGEWAATYSRGPRLHAAHGNFLGMGDYVMVKLDVERRRGVALWADGKFDFGYRVDIDHETCKALPHKTNSTALRAWLLRGETS